MISERDTWSGWLLLPLLAATGCAHLKAPDQGGRPWVRAATEHLELRTDLDAEEARRFVARLEQLRSAMMLAGWGFEPGAPSARTQVVLFRSVKELRVFADQQFLHQRDYMTLMYQNVQAFIALDAMRRPLLVTSADTRFDDNDGLVAMLARVAARPFPRGLPWWLREGMTAYLSSGNVNGDGFRLRFLSQATRNAPPVEHVRDGRRPHGAYDQRIAHLVVQHLRTADAAAFRELVLRLAGGEPEAAAFAAAFPGLTNSELDQIVAQGEADEPSRSVRAAFPAESAVSAVALAPADVHALWAELYLGGFTPASPTGWREQGQQEIDAALRLDPQNVSAHLLLLRRMSAEEKLRTLEELEAAHPEDPRPLDLLLTAAGLSDDERMKRAERALALDPEDTDAKAMRAILLARAGRAAEAAEVAQDALAVSAPTAQLYDALASAEEAQGHCPRALEAASSGALAATARQKAGELRPLLDRLDRLERRCGGVADAAAADLPNGAIPPAPPPSCGVPAIPDDNVRSGIGGVVTATFAVLADGRVGSIALDDGNVSAPLFVAARAWLRGCRFNPARAPSGEVLPARISRSFVFKLQ